MILKTKPNIKKCVVCGRKFECYAKAKTNHPNEKVKRLFRAVTCKNSCSKKYRYLRWSLTQSPRRNKKCLKKD
jgi:hypothetical protein